MNLLKALFKIVFKWIFQLMMSAERKGSAMMAAKQQSANGNGAKPHSETSDVGVDKAMCHIQQAFHQFEENVVRAAEQMEATVSGAGTQQPEQTLDLNELRAELAELKADIRGLQRMMTQKSDTHDNTHTPS